jgi:hypothetical protein
MKMKHKTQLIGDNALKVQRELADEISMYLHDHNMSQRDLSGKMGLGAGVVNANVKNWRTMSVSFILQIADDLPGFKGYKERWLRAVAQDLGVNPTSVVGEQAEEAIERSKKIRSTILEIQGLLANLMHEI